MKKTLILAAGAAVVVLTGCQSVDPSVERGPHGTIAYDVLIEASEPGARIEANGSSVGNAPVHIKIFGDKDGTFHDFGSYQYVIRAYPLTTNQFAQYRAFGTGRHGVTEDHIPERIYFDMNQNTPPPPPEYVYPPYGPPAYYYGPPPYYGPGVRLYFGPRVYHHRRW